MEKNAKKKVVNEVENAVDTTTTDWEAKYNEAIKENERRIIEKEKYITRVEDECDAKVANKDLVIRGLQANLAEANKQVAELTARNNKLEKELQKRQKGIIAWLFGYKK